MKDPEKMTPEDLVRFLAVEGMGWELSLDKSVWCDKASGECLRDVDDFDPRTVPADRDMLVDAMRERGFKLTILISEGKHSPYDVFVLNRDICVAHAADMPGDAVCVAAAKALLAEKEKSG